MCHGIEKTVEKMFSKNVKICDYYKSYKYIVCTCNTDLELNKTQVKEILKKSGMKNWKNLKVIKYINFCLNKYKLQNILYILCTMIATIKKKHTFIIVFRWKKKDFECSFQTQKW